MGNVISPEDILKNYGADILKFGISVRLCRRRDNDKNILIQHADLTEKLDIFRFMLEI